MPRAEREPMFCDIRGWGGGGGGIVTEGVSATGCINRVSANMCIIRVY